MFDFSTLITDRNQGDLDALEGLLSVPSSEWTPEQLAQFNQAVERGAYNASDLNRVTSCVDYLASVFQDLGYAVPGYTASGITWANDNVPTQAQMAQYLSNVQALMDVLTTAQYSVELPESMALLTYASANNIETILEEINAYLTALSGCFMRSGTAWATSGSPGFYFAN